MRATYYPARVKTKTLRSKLASTFFKTHAGSLLFFVSVTVGAIFSWQGGFMQRSMSRPLGADSFSSPIFSMDCAKLFLLASTWMLTVLSLAEVECNPSCIAVLKARQADGLLHQGQVVEDVRCFSAKGSGACGLTAGFPCQAN